MYVQYDACVGTTWRWTAVGRPDPGSPAQRSREYQEEWVWHHRSPGPAAQRIPVSQDTARQVCLQFKLLYAWMVKP